ncbi:glycine zipper 2TM domain-containing protein [Caldimonas brevitalea]|uniref:Outer membrane lipoprotein n=1 Tax=Caldimonas brevitalea TaxID=413882 RepID=A0A0G3BNN9_9BURK|nr:glycine zipper 2TM domain-containing protein [Caldimonas brevitalea]AKJ31069.1 outer membrane lipoprotein [Caldimonas brevitalea]
MNTPSSSLDAAAPVAAPPHGLTALPRAVWMAGGVALFTIGGLASALVLQARSPAPATSAAAPVQALQTGPQLAAPTESATLVPPQTPSEGRPASLVPPEPTRDAPREPEAREMQPAAAAVCRHCGVVESVRAVQHKGEGTGVGAVAGGVVGGLLGNQVGKGNGRKAMTVVGAVGGGFAGHEIEKRARSVTVYRVKVRMDDGTLRTVSHPQAPAVGQRVTVQGRTLRMAAAPEAGSPDAPRTWKTNAAADAAGA